MKKIRPPEIYHVITHGKHGFSLFKQGNKRATKTWKDGLSMRGDLSWYIVNRNCKIIIHNKNAEVTRIITSEGIQEGET